MADPVPEDIVHRDRELLEPVGGIAVRPATPLLKGLGQIPVVQGEPGHDACFQQLVHQPAVEVETLPVDLAIAWLDARPARREPICTEAELLHECDVFRHPVIMVGSHFGGISVCDGVRYAREHVPDGVFLAILMRRAFDLSRSGRRTPEKTGWKAHSV